MITNIAGLKKLLETAVQDAQENKIRYKKLYETDLSLSGENEFLFFIKPEITMRSSGLRFDLILDMLFARLDDFNLKIKDIRIINFQYLKDHNIIAQHYGIINAVSTSPMTSLSEEAKEKFRLLTGKTISEAALSGSIEMLNNFHDFTPVSLDYLWQNVKTEKLAGGTYMAKINIDGSERYIINGFHPRQLMHYVQSGRCIITMTLTGDISWKDARNNFIGVTNPADAQPQSLRSLLLQNKTVYGLQTVSSSWNGFHLSAGPVEGLVELMRYNSDFAQHNICNHVDFHFGNMLEKEFNQSNIEKILHNTTANADGKMISVFDLTEEKNSSEAIGILKKYFK
jgi:nucleoside diphosphate kinase